MTAMVKITSAGRTKTAIAFLFEKKEFIITPELVAKVGCFCTALAVSQAIALRNVHFSAGVVAKLKFCNSLSFFDKITQQSMTGSINSRIVL
jgi:hypothetical protein